MLLVLNYGYFKCVLFWQTVFRTHITIMVDWALKINYLSTVPKPFRQCSRKCTAGGLLRTDFKFDAQISNLCVMLTHTISKQSRRLPVSLNRFAKIGKQISACLIRIYDAREAHIIFKLWSRRSSVSWIDLKSSESKTPLVKSDSYPRCSLVEKSVLESLAVADSSSNITFFLHSLQNEAKHVALNLVDRSQDAVGRKTGQKCHCREGDFLCYIGWV